MKKKAFFVVGHSNWGKSHTLRHLTGGNVRKRRVELEGEVFYIRRMSNDDDETKLLEFVTNEINKKGNHAIIAFCPVFEAGRQSKEILEILKKDFDLYFFVIKHEFKGDRVVTTQEIEILTQYGKYEVLNERIESSERTERLKAFILNN